VLRDPGPGSWRDGARRRAGGGFSGETGETDVDGLESIHRRKTGALIAAALQLGCVAAGGTAAQLAALEQYGRHLGLAFQITDDLLDVAGDQDAVGKRLAKDAARGKATYPILLGVDESRGRAGWPC